MSNIPTRNVTSVFQCKWYWTVGVHVNQWNWSSFVVCDKRSDICAIILLLIQSTLTLTDSTLSVGNFVIKLFLPKPVQAARNWCERQRAAWVASCVKSRSSAYNNKDWISSWIWYIATRNIETMPRKLARQTFLIIKSFAISTVQNHTDPGNLQRFHSLLQEMSMEVIQTARWRSPMLVEPSVRASSYWRTWATISYLYTLGDCTGRSAENTSF